jgi:Zn-dependent M16 (insulinase) family peptidase
MNTWVHGGNPVDYLQFNKNVAKLREEMQKNPRFFQEKIKKYFLENPHKLVTVMTPDPAYNEKLNEAERQQLAEISKKLTESDKKKIVEDGVALLQRQNMKPGIVHIVT